MDEETATIDFYDTSARSWMAGGHNTAGFWGEYMVEFKKLLPSGDVLEIGTGAGRDAYELTQLGYGYLGVEPSAGMLALAQERNPELEFVKATIQELDIARMFDGFWCAASLLHIPKKEIPAVLQKIKTMLKPGAVGFISLKKYLGEGFEERQESQEGGSRFFAYWQSAEFETVLVKNGFEVVKTFERPMSKTTWLVFLVKNLAE